MKQVAIVFILLVYCCSKIQSQTIQQKLLFQEQFEMPLDTSFWKVEKSPKSTEMVVANNHQLLINTYEGATIWYSKPLPADVYISFNRIILIDSGKNDRLSDCNVFFMATDTKPQRMFNRNSNFVSYDSLSMYYVGVGGNYNTTTRFRKYGFDGSKNIIGEYTDSAHLLKPNTNYFIEITCLNGRVEYKVNGELFFQFQDPKPLLGGYFAFRSTRSRQVISNFQVYQLIP